jgi:hypothetical protein
MKTEINRVVDMNAQKVFKSITIKTDLNETVFEGKLYSDSVVFKKSVVDEEELLKEIENIPNLLKNS